MAATQTAEVLRVGTPRTAGVRQACCPQCGAPVELPAYADWAVCAYCGSRLLAAGPTAGGSVNSGAGPSATALAQNPGGAAERVTSLRGLNCPQCAGPLAVESGRRTVICQRCGTRFLVSMSGGPSRWFLESTLDKLGALKVAARWLEQYPTLNREARTATLENPQLVYLPLWEHRSLVAGWEFGAKLRTQSVLVSNGQQERLELELVRENLSESRLQERRYYRAACDLREVGARRPRLSGREPVKPLFAGELAPEAVVIPTLENPADIAAEGRRAALGPVSGAEAPDCHSFVLRERVSLIFYPFWIVHYQVRRRRYRLVVDGWLGTVNSAVAPADGRRQRLRRLSLVVGGAAVTLLLLWLGATLPGSRAALLGAAVVVSVLTALGALRVQARTEVEYHEPFSS